MSHLSTLCIPILALSTIYVSPPLSFTLAFTGAPAVLTGPSFYPDTCPSPRLLSCLTTSVPYSVSQLPVPSRAVASSCQSDTDQTTRQEAGLGASVMPWGEHCVL